MNKKQADKIVKNMRLLSAVSELSDHCATFEDQNTIEETCKICIFFNSKECILRTSPETWKDGFIKILNEES